MNLSVVSAGVDQTSRMRIGILRGATRMVEFDLGRVVTWPPTENRRRVACNIFKQHNVHSTDSRVAATRSRTRALGDKESRVVV